MQRQLGRSDSAPTLKPMLTTIRKVSLRTRLALLAAFAIVALMIALFVAWRLARATETFALRQADSSVHNAARDLAREVQANPNGYQTTEQAMPTRPDRVREEGRPGRDERARRVPPHVEKVFAAYSDPFDRLTATTLHRYPDVEGGFYRATDDVFIGYASQSDSAASVTGNVSPDLANVVRALAARAATNGSPASSTSQIGSNRVLLVAYSPQGDGIETAWAMQRLSHLSGVSDWPNLAALVALALSIIAVSGLALITVRDLHSGVTGIEAGLVELKSDLSSPLSPPDTEELARIAASINGLAATLRANIARQAELEQDLRRSERLSALGRVVAGVAHEVRNPLAAIKLKVQLARRSSYAPDKLSETFNVISAEIERLDKLVRRLLELGGQQRLELDPVDLCELVSMRVAFFNDLATRARVAIAINAAPERVVTEGDVNRLAQVVDNIIQNALDAMPDGGQLTITCKTIELRAGSKSAYLSFEDTGHGILPADQEHIFEPFYTGRDTGTGLGLAIARAIVEEHGGRLSFLSREGNGTSFVIELPYAASLIEASN